MIQQLGRRLITASPLADENAGPRKPGSASQRPDWGFLFWNNAISFRRWSGVYRDLTEASVPRPGGRGFLL